MLIEARDAVFGYGTPIVGTHHLGVERGACLGMFGANGSGKTTLVRGLMGLLAPMAGTVRRQDGLRLGYLPQIRTLDAQWPVTGLDAASMAISARSRFGRVRQSRRIHEALELLEVRELAHRPMQGLSGGQQQRVLLAGALAAEPDVLVLDEPTEGLDIRSRSILLRALGEAGGRGIGAILISHTLDDLTTACTEVACIEPSEDKQTPATVAVMGVAELVGAAHAARGVV